MYSQPIISVKEAAEKMGVSQQSANLLIKKLVELGVLYENTGYSRNRAFIYKEYLGLFS
jgi:Fic family protein